MQVTAAISAVGALALAAFAAVVLRRNHPAQGQRATQPDAHPVPLPHTAEPAQPELLERAFVSLGLDRLAERRGLSRTLSEIGVEVPLSRIARGLTFWLVLLLMLEPSKIPSAGIGCFAMSPIDKGSRLAISNSGNRKLQVHEIPDTHLKYCPLLESGLYLAPADFAAMSVAWYMESVSLICPL